MIVNFFYILMYMALSLVVLHMYDYSREECKSYQGIVIVLVWPFIITYRWLAKGVYRL